MFRLQYFKRKEEMKTSQWQNQNAIRCDVTHGSILFYYFILFYFVDYMTMSTRDYCFIVFFNFLIFFGFYVLALVF